MINSIESTRRRKYKNSRDNFDVRHEEENYGVYNQSSPVCTGTVNTRYKSLVDNNPSSYRNHERREVNSHSNRSYEYYSDNSSVSENIDRRKYRDKNVSSNDKLISKLHAMEQQMEKQREELENFKNARNNRTFNSNKHYGSEKYVDYNSMSKLNKDEDDNEDDEEESPDYENMSEDEIVMYKNTFKLNFEMLAKTYPSFVTSIPDIDKLNLRTVHNIFCEIVNTIVIMQLAQKLKTVTIFIFFIAEYIGYKRYGIEIMKRMGQVQMKRIDNLNPFFMGMANFFLNSMKGVKSNLIKCIFNAAMSIVSFLGAKTLGNVLDTGDLSDSVLLEVDKFFTIEGSRVKIRNTGIPDIPPLPSEFQDPAKILERAKGPLMLAGLIDEPEVARPVKEKDEEDDYDDVY